MAAFGIDDIEESEDFDKNNRVDEKYQAMGMIDAVTFLQSQGVEMSDTPIYTGK